MTSVIFSMLIDLLNKEQITAKELAYKYEVSERTILRYVDALSMAGVPIYTERGRGGGIKIADNYKLTSNYLTREEMARLLNALTVMEQGIESDITKTIKDKLLALKPPKRNQDIPLSADTIIIDGSAWGDTSAYKEKTEVLEKAIKKFNTVILVYHDRGGKITNRTVEPISFVLKEGLWYLYAYCRLRNDYRTFKISRIESIIINSEHFEKHSSDKGFSFTEIEQKDSLELILKVYEKARYDVEEWLGIESVKPSKEGNFYIASANLIDSHELMGKLMSFGGNIKILSPKSLQKRLLVYLNEALKINME